MRFVVVASALGLAVPASAGPLLGNSDIAAEVARYRAAPDDQFTPKPTQEAIIGRGFKVATRFPAMSDRGGPRLGRIGGWLYNANSGELTIEPWIGMTLGADLTSDRSFKGIQSFRGFTISSQGRYHDQVWGGNVVAPVKVDRYVNTTIFVGTFEADVMQHVFPGFAGEDIQVTVAMPPAEARDVTPHLVLVVEGSIAPYAQTRAIACGDEGTVETRAHPVSQTLDECVVSANITRFAIEDERNGRVLAQWLPQ